MRDDVIELEFGWPVSVPLSYACCRLALFYERFAKYIIRLLDTYLRMVAAGAFSSSNTATS